MRITRGFSGSSRAMHSFCCCSSESRVALRLEPVLDLVPKLHVAQGRFDHGVLLGRGCRSPRPTWTRTPKSTFSRIEIGSGLGRWKTMPTDLRSSLSETSGS